MEEAYVVGIRLVLENGISGGLSSIGRDLATFDRALAATTGNLQALRDLGAGLAMPAAAGQPAREQGRPQAEAREPTAEPSDRPARAEALTPQLPASAPALLVTAPAGGESTAVSVPSPRDGFSDNLPVWGAMQAMPLREAPDSHAPVVATAPLPTAPPPPERVAPAAQPAGFRTMMRYADFAPAAPPGPVAVSETLSAGAREGAASAVETEATQVPRRADVMVALHQHFARPGEGGPLPPSLAPEQAEVAPRIEAPLRLAPTLAASQPAAAPVASSAAAGPVQGDVYLDGTRMGRWMADHLAREADRPQTGVTGFDSRLGLAWPGSMHGT
jgi:hypothetical protein